MKIVIFGANGKTGSLLLEQALELGHQVTAYVRKPNSIKLTHPNLKVLVGNLNETLRLRDAINGSDACISALGGSSLTNRSPEIVKGIEKILEIMEDVDTKRFIYLSSIGAGESRFLMAQPIRFLIVNLLLRVPLADHNENEQHISATNLNWTIVRPGGLTDNAKTDNLKQHGTEKVMMTGNRSISRANVAAFMLDQLTNNTYSKKAVWLYE